MSRRPRPAVGPNQVQNRQGSGMANWGSATPASSRHTCTGSGRLPPGAHGVSDPVPPPSAVGTCSTRRPAARPHLRDRERSGWPNPVSPRCHDTTRVYATCRRPHVAKGTARRRQPRRPDQSAFGFCLVSVVWYSHCQSPLSAQMPMRDARSAPIPPPAGSGHLFFSPGAC